jgi:hypothetical protein
LIWPGSEWSKLQHSLLFACACKRVKNVAFADFKQVAFQRRFVVQSIAVFPQFQEYIVYSFFGMFCGFQKP